jgi:hypothetical protein
MAGPEVSGLRDELILLREELALLGDRVRVVEDLLRSVRWNPPSRSRVREHRRRVRRPGG